MGKGPRKSGHRSSRNTELAHGVNEVGRSLARQGRGAFRHAKKGYVKPAEKKLTAPKERESRFYVADDVKKPIKSRKGNHNPTRLRKSLIPGTILILLAGRFKGKRVVLLKQLESGLLLVTGPYKVNGVPLRRVNQAYVIATSTRVDLAGVDVTKINDAFFAKTTAKPAKKDGEEFLSQEKKKVALPKEKLAAQKSVDTALLATIKKTENLRQYLNAKFSLSKYVFPHAIKF